MVGVTCPDIVGRHAERECLEGVVRRGLAGDGTVAVVVGEAGVGKSRLVRDVSDMVAAAGARRFIGRGVQYQTAVPFRPLAEALMSALRSTDVPDTAELRPYRVALARIVPELDGSHDPPPHAASVVIGEAIIRLLAALGTSQGSVLIVEDLHWADPDTVEVLRYVVDNVAGEPVAVLITARPERGHGRALIREIETRRAATVVHLDPLDGAAVTTMAAACLRSDGVPDDVAAALAATSGGVPFLVEELLAAWIHAGELRREGDHWVTRDLTSRVPASVGDAVRDRMVSLATESREVIEAAAVLGRRFHWQLLADIVGAEERDVLSALRAAVDLQLLEPDGPMFRFRHALTRDAVVGGLLDAQRAVVARRALEVLQRAPELSDSAAALAAELAVGIDDRNEAARLLLLVGRRAAERGALATAEEALFRARGLLGAASPMSVEVDDELVAALSLAGKTDVALSVGADLLERLATVAHADVSRWAVHIRLGRAAAAACRWTTADEHLSAARSLVAADDAAAHAATDAVAAHVAVGTGDVPRAETLAAAAVASAESAGLPDVTCESLEVLGRCARRSDLRRAERAFARSAEVAETHGLAVWHVRALHELGTIDLLRHGGTRLERLEDARRAADRVGALATAATVDLQLAAGHITCFRHEDALDAVARATALARPLRLEVVEAVATAFEAAVHAQRGDRPALERSARRALALAPGHPDVEMIVHGQARAMLALLDGDDRAALVALDRAAAAARLTDAPTPAPFRGVWALVTEVADVGSGDGARACAEVRATGGAVHVVVDAYLAYAEAVRLGRAGDRSQAQRFVQRADRTAAELPWYLHIGRWLVARPALVGSWGTPDRWVLEALDFFDANGAAKLATSCRSILRRAGLPVPRRTGDRSAVVPSKLRSLGITAREAEVLQLLVSGLSNREIAARLFLSPRTVERHLSNLSRKTGASNRTQLAAIAARAEPAGAPAPLDGWSSNSV